MNNKTMKKYILTLMFLSPLFSVFSQDGVSLWAGANASKKINKKLGFSIGAQVRMPENITYTQSYLVELGASYKLIKGLELSGYYRFINKRKDETKVWKNRHRFYTDLSYGNKLGPIKFENRLRYQHQFKDNDGEIGFDKSYLRNKLEFSYPNKSDFTPFVSGDLFYEIGGVVDQLRPKAGVNYKINKKNAIEASIFKNVDLVGTESSGPIIGLSYKVKL